MMNRLLFLVALLSPGLGFAAPEATVTYDSTFNLRVGSTIVSSHATLQQAIDAAIARGIGSYSITQPTANVTVTDPSPPPCVYGYSSWGSCHPDGTQTRTVVSTTPGVCTPTTQILSQSCTYVPPCVYTYSAWGSCQPDGTQTRTVVSTTPAVCTPTTQMLSQSCTYVPPPSLSVTTLAPTSIAQTSAMLNGSVTAGSTNASTLFEWGATTSYGNQVAGAPATVTAGQTASFSANITGLACGTSYHYRAVANQTPGQNAVFTASSCTTSPPPTGYSTSWSSVPAQGGAAITSAFAGAAATIGAYSKRADSGTTSPQFTPAVNTSPSGSSFVIDVLMRSESMASVSDNKGNTYGLHATVNNYSGSYDVQRFVCLNCVGGPGHVVQVKKISGSETAEVTFFFTEIRNSTALAAAPVGGADATNPITIPDIVAPSAPALLLSVMAGDGYSANYQMTCAGFMGVDFEPAASWNTAQGATAYRLIP